MFRKLWIVFLFLIFVSCTSYKVVKDATIVIKGVTANPVYDPAGKTVINMDGNVVVVYKNEGSYLYNSAPDVEVSFIHYEEVKDKKDAKGLVEKPLIMVYHYIPGNGWFTRNRQTDYFEKSPQEVKTILLIANVGNVDVDEVTVALKPPKGAVLKSINTGGWVWDGKDAESYRKGDVYIISFEKKLFSRTSLFAGFSWEMSK
jgi:hypothetical protein